MHGRPPAGDCVPGQHLCGAADGGGVQDLHRLLGDLHGQPVPQDAARECAGARDGPRDGCRSRSGAGGDEREPPHTATRSNRPPRAALAPGSAAWRVLHLCWLHRGRGQADEPIRAALPSGASIDRGSPRRARALVAAVSPPAPSARRRDTTPHPLHSTPHPHSCETFSWTAWRSRKRCWW